MNAIPHAVLQFEGFAVDLDRGCLRVGGREVELRPKTFQVLQFLALNAGRLVSKDELFEAAWPNVTVSDDSLVQCIRELREKLGDGGHQIIKTLPKRGYMLDAAAVPRGTASAGATPDAAPGASRSGANPLAHLRTRAGAGSWWSAAAIALVAIFGTGLLLGPSSVNSLVGKGGTEAPRTQPVTFKDCEECPEMVALPAGEFVMGTPAEDRGRHRLEGAARSVRIAKPIAIGRFEITIDQFSAFLSETGMEIEKSCRVIATIDYDPPAWTVTPGIGFREPGFAVTGSHPAGCINRHDAQAYVAWLRRKTGKPYRLPTEAEWEYAARAGSTTRFSFGDDAEQLCVHARFADLGSQYAWRDACRGTMPEFGSLKVGTLKPNPWGLFDMHGNVWEWAADCYTPDTRELAADGSAFQQSANCEVGVIRGGSWLSGSPRLRSAVRIPMSLSSRYQNNGFRVALSLDE